MCFFCIKKRDMKLYYIDDEYIKYLRQYEDKIIYNTKAALLHKRIYTGVVFSIKDITYFAPLTSPKPNKPLIKKLVYDINGGKLGHILLNNMIPCSKNNISQIEFKMIDDIKYRRLLENQYRNISSNEKIIINKANKIYKNVIVNQIKIFIKSCCDFKKLEEVYNKYPKL